ncbi:MAG TPA: DNA topoisomerase IB [Thermoanaerobaculia bacterium]
MPRQQGKRDLLRRGIRRIGTKESGFRYVTASGARVTDAKTLERIASLKVPPAWREVRIATRPRAPLQAIGLDSKGRTQYRYHPSFRRKREDEKYRRVVGFGEVLPRLRARVSADLAKEGLGRERVLATIVRLIDQGFFRVGNDKSAKSEATFGLTTVRGDHVTVQGGKVTFDFVGKWRKAHKRSLTDPAVAKVVRELKSRDADGELFRWYEDDGRVVDVKDRHVNEYIQSIIGARFTAKDFRTWAGTLVASVLLGNKGPAETKKARKKKLKEAIDETAMLLGNTPAVSRSSYICPRLLHDYEAGHDFAPMRRAVSPIPKKGNSAAEKALLRFLRETIADRRLGDRRRRATSAGYRTNRRGALGRRASETPSDS